MVRIATVNDADQLNHLNIAFNGEGEAGIENIKDSLLGNKQEVVVVVEEDEQTGLYR